MLRGAPVASVPPLSHAGGGCDEKDIALPGRSRHHRFACVRPDGDRRGKPEMETITFSDTFEDEFLTEACGIDVTT
jgi:hypothetical protein